MYNQGEIVIVPFPFTDLRSVKQRPVLILSKNSDNHKSEDIITCGITSNLKNTNYSILVENKNLDEGQIPKPSRVKVDKLFTINQNIVVKKVAQVDKETFSRVKAEFNNLI